jgi:hypothetical protein
MSSSRRHHQAHPQAKDRTRRTQSRGLQLRHHNRLSLRQDLRPGPCLQSRLRHALRRAVAVVEGKDHSLMGTNPPADGMVTAKAPSKHALFEPVGLVLLSLATVGTAWCSFQAATWGGVSQRTMNLSAIAGRRAVANELQSYQLRLADVMLFSHYINARASSSETLARFYADRFRGEAKTAFEAWMATHPFENANAPAHPFVTNLYQPRLLADASVAEAESQRLWQEAGEAGRTSRGYVLITVLLASALFCGGTASKFDMLWIRRAVRALGLAAFVLAAVRLFMLPSQL